MGGMGMGHFGGCRGICSERTAYSTDINSQKASEIVLSDIVGLGEGERGETGSGGCGGLGMAEATASERARRPEVGCAPGRLTLQGGISHHP